MLHDLDRKIHSRRRIFKALIYAALILAIFSLVQESLILGIMLAGVAGVLILLFPWLISTYEVHDLTPQLRRHWPDRQFAQLSGGCTHYQLAGPEDGQPVVFLTGLTSSFFIWDHQFHALAEAGFRVLRYDYFGRGLSDRPRVAYGSEIFQQQLLDLLDHVGFGGPVDLVGLSMGGATIVHFMDAYPDRVRRYVLIAPAGLPAKRGLKARLLRLPGVGEWIMTATGDQAVLRQVRADFGENPQKLQQAEHAYLAQMQFHGYKRALLSTYRHNPLHTLKGLYERAGSQPKMALLIWGDKDRVIPYEKHKQIQAAIPNIRLHTVEGGTHPVCFQRPEAVTPVLVDFLQR